MAIKGRGTDNNPHNRFAPRVSVFEPHSDAAETGDAPPSAVDAAAPKTPAPKTIVAIERARSIISSNDSPDVPFELSINPYRGCEHGCIYCFARPTHAYLDLSPGLDFETQLTAKTNAAEVLRAELAKPSYRCKPITLGANTDPYQPIEKQYRVTRQILEVLWEHKHPCSIISKSQLICEDLSLLTQMARENLLKVFISVTTLNDDLKRKLEPRAASGQARINTLAQLADAGIPVGVLAAPMIPALNDSELETILAAARQAGAESAGYILLRLPLEVSELFEAWLHEHFPLRAEHILSLIRQSRGGKNYDSKFGSRMRGSGVFAELLATRFRRSCRALHLNERETILSIDKFRVPSAQMTLW